MVYVFELERKGELYSSVKEKEWEVWDVVGAQ